MAIGDFSLNSELFLHTAKNQLVEKHLHFYFKSVRVCYFKGTVSRYIDKNRTGACGLGRNRRLLRYTELVFLSTVCARRVVLVLFTNMDAVN